MNICIKKIARIIASAAKHSAINSCREVSKDRMYQPKTPKSLLEQQK
jgi:hypothetical protein